MEAADAPCTTRRAKACAALGGVREIYEPAYVEDLDVGYRGWRRGWPTVFVAGARVVHRHRATTSRYYTEAQLDAILEVNYLRFLTGAVASPALFGRLWREAIERLRILPAAEPQRSHAAQEGLRFACRAPFLTPRPDAGVLDEEEFLALTAGGVAVFPGQAQPAQPFQIITLQEPPEVAPNGAVVVYYSDNLATPSAELLANAAEIVVVKLDAGEAAFRAAVRQTERKWRGLLGPAA